MSVIVKGMEMPDNCNDCWFSIDVCDVYCYVHKKPKKVNGDAMNRRMRPDWCPLRPLPEKHGRLIDEDEAYDRIMEQDGGNYIDMDGVGMGLDECRTIVEAEGDER